MVQPSSLPDVSSFGPRGGNPQLPHGSFGTQFPQAQTPFYGSAPHMGPTWGSPGVMVGGAARNAAIGIVVAVAIALLGVGGIVAFALLGSTMDSGGGTTDHGTPILVNTNQPVPGILTSTQPTRTYEFVTTQVGLVTVSVEGDFDSFLELYVGDESTPRWSDDDSGGSLNARIMASLEPGRYFALVRPFSEGTTGSYTFAVTAPMEPTPMTGPPGTTPPMNPPTPYPGTPGVPGTGAVTPQDRTGVVAAVSGPAPVTSGSQCTVRISSANTQGGHNCRVVVTCGGSVIYGHEDARGQYGFNRCTVVPAGGGPATIEAHDTSVSPVDGDPRIDLQTAFGEIVVTDQDSAGRMWTVSIRFTSPAGAPDAPTTAI